MIGNPPYVDVKLLGDDIKETLSDRFASATKRFDLYIPFVEQGLLLLRDNGLLGYVLPSMFTRREYGSSLRQTITTLGTVEQVADFGTNQVFKGPLNYVAIFIFGKSGEQDSVPAVRFDRTGLDEVELAQGLDGEELAGVKRLNVPAEAFLTSSEWFLLDRMEAELYSRLFGALPSLETILKNASEGIHSGKDQVFFCANQSCSGFILRKSSSISFVEGERRSQIPTY